MAISERYEDLALGHVDASVVALAERYVRRVATRDVRHFTAVRTGDGRALELLVQDGETASRPANRRRELTVVAHRIPKQDDVSSQYFVAMLGGIPRRSRSR